MKKETIKYTIILIVWVVGFMFMLGVGLDKQRKVDCIKWQTWAEEYPDFYLTRIQSAQCEELGIEVEAPVQKTVEAVKVIEPKYREIFATVYAYSSEESQTDADPYTMATGNKVYDGAIANNCLRFGTMVMIDDIWYTVEDRMNEKYGCNYFDIWMESKEEAIKFGKQTKQVYVLLHE